MMGFFNSDTDVFGWPTIAVDTHFFRVSNRNQSAIGKNIDSVEQKL
jgi:endonuclease-3